MTQAEIGEVHYNQPKECQGLPESPKAGRDEEEHSRRVFRESTALLTP